MSLAAIQTDLAAARAAILEDDYASALRYALAAQALLAATPDQQDGEHRLAFQQTGSEVASLIASIRRQQAAANAASTSFTRRRNVTYANPST